MNAWLFDLGNTRLKWAQSVSGQTGPIAALNHRVAGFEKALDQSLAELPRADQAWLASVAAPDLAARISALCHRHGVPCQSVQTLPECAGVRIAYTDPDALGVDRFLALLAAHRRGPGPWLIVSVGTALTIDLLDDGGVHHGGLIAPAPDLMRRSLAEHAARLHETPGVARHWGRNTEDAIASGTQSAALGLIERSYALACDELNDTPLILIGGGGAAPLLEHLPLPATPVDELVLQGLAVYASQA